MKSTSTPVLSDLRRSLAEVAARRAGPAAEEMVSFGAEALDEALGGGLARAALHEIYAGTTADIAAATGVALALAARAAPQRPILWVRQDFVDAESGRVHAPGVAELGLDPGRLLLVRAHDADDVLRAGSEGARCAALGAVLIEPWGEPRRLDLTASRRLTLAAEEAGVTTLLLRLAAAEAPSAARTRWRVGSLPSRPLEANAPGFPSFCLELLRHRGGLARREWRVEWDRDRQSFVERHAFVERSAFVARAAFDAGPAPLPGRPGAPPLPRPLAAFPGDGQVAAGGADSGLRRAG